MRLSYEFIRDELATVSGKGLIRKRLTESYYPFDCYISDVICFYKSYGKRSGEVRIIFDSDTHELDRIEAEVKHVDNAGRSQAFMDVANFIHKMIARGYIERGGIM